MVFTVSSIRVGVGVVSLVGVARVPISGVGVVRVFTAVIPVIVAVVRPGRDTL